MKIVDIAKIEEKEEDYSLNIDNLIRDLNKSPDDYVIFNSIINEGEQNILVSKKGKNLLKMQTSSKYISVTDKKSAVCYSVSKDYDYSDYYEDDKDNKNNKDDKELGESQFSEFSIYKSFDDEAIEINFDVMITKDEDNKNKMECIGGYYSIKDEKTENRTHVSFSIDDDFDEDEDEIENDEDETEDEYGEYEDEDIEDDNLEDSESDKELAFLIFKDNDTELADKLTDKDYKEVEEGIYQLFSQATEDFSTKIIEILELRKAISRRIKRCINNTPNQGNQEVDQEIR